MDKKNRVFISYKRIDKDVVFELKAKIEQYFYSGLCWIDLDGIESDAQFVNVIIKAINKADLLLFMYSSAHSEITDYENDWTIRELNFAQEKNKRIVFVNIDNTPLNDWFRMMFPRKQQVDGTSDNAIKKLIQDLKTWLIQEPISKEESVYRNVCGEGSVIVENDDDFETAEVLFEAKDYNEAISFYLTSAEKGNIIARKKICQILYDNHAIVDSISDTIWSRIEKLSKRGDSYIYFILHCRYYNDPFKKAFSFDYVKRATQDKEIPLAFLRLGIHYGWGVGTKQNHILAMHNYVKASEVGCKEAYSYIGSEYEWGTVKAQKNVDKAIEFYKKGAELHDKRSMIKLAKSYFYDLNNVEKAKDVAQQMIQCGHTLGYVLMGDFCVLNPDGNFNNNNIEEGKKWYGKALLYDEYEAYASLAQIYWGVEGNHKEAYSLAKQGFLKHNSFSTSLLAYFHYCDHEFDEAWKLYMDGYERFGTNTDQIGDLFFNCNFRKGKEEEEAQLEKDLENVLKVGAHNGNIESLKYLIRLHALQEFGEDTYNYELFTKSVQIQEDIQSGAEIGHPEMMFYYGKLLLEDNYREFNPAKGIRYLINTAENGYTEALSFLLDYNKSGSHNDNIEFDKVASIAIKNSFTDKRYLNELLLFVNNNDDMSDDFQKYLRNIIDRGRIYDNRKYYCIALNTLLNKFREGRLSLEQDELNKYKKVIEEERLKKNFRFVSYFKYNLQLLYPEFNEQRMFSDYSIADEVNRQLFFAINCAKGKDIDINLQDVFLENLHGLITFDKSLASDEKNYRLSVQKLVMSMQDFRDSYHELCDNLGVRPIEYAGLEKKHLFPYVPTGVCAKLAYDTFSLFMSLRDVIPERYAPMQSVLSDDEELLDYIELLDDEILQTFFVSFIEVKFEIQGVMIENYDLCKNYLDGNKKPVVDYLNNFLEKFGDKVLGVANPFTTENLPEFYDLKSDILKKILDNSEKLVDEKGDPSSTNVVVENSGSTDVTTLSNNQNAFGKTNVVVGQSAEEEFGGSPLLSNFIKDKGPDADSNKQSERYDMLQNASGEILIIIEAQDTAPQNPRLLYDGGDRMLLYRNRESARFLNNIKEDAIRALSKVDKVLVVEIEDEDVAREYEVPLRRVKSLKELI